MTPLRVCMSAGPTSSGWTSPRPPPAIIAGPPMPSETFCVATIRSAQPAMTALPAKQRPATTAMRGHEPGQPRPQREGARVERRDDGVVRVARAPAAALGEEDGGQAHALDQLEQAVLLAVPEDALRAGQHRVVVGQHRAGAARAEELAVDARRARHEAVGGRARDEVVEVAAGALGGDREAPVLDERARVDEVGDVLARGAPAGRAAALDRLGPRRRPASARGGAGPRRGPRAAPASPVVSGSATRGMLPEPRRSAPVRPAGRRRQGPRRAAARSCGPAAR